MELLELIKQDMKPAFGVTEPGAIAFAVAKAKEYITGEVLEVIVELNSGMYKNAFTCGIPNSTEYGNVFAAALGVVGGKAELGLESLSCITPEDNVEAQACIDAGKVKVKLHHIGSEIYIYVMIRGLEQVCELTIVDGHTNIVEIKVNEIIVFKKNINKEKTIESVDKGENHTDNKEEENYTENGRQGVGKWVRKQVDFNWYRNTVQQEINLKQYENWCRDFKRGIRCRHY